MRIVAGQAKGRSLSVPPGNNVRPTTDRVREALFSILFEEVRGARVLDLFAGSGALGLEALSRGASTAVFVEQSRGAVSALRRNIEGCAVGDRVELLCMDALRALDRLAAKGELFDLVFLDPPYDTDLVARTLQDLWQRQLLAPGALIVAEQRAGAPLPAAADLQLVDERRYGDTALRFFTTPQARGNAPDPVQGANPTMSQIALYPGSFDPFTNGHLGIAQRALEVFNGLIIAIAVNSRKTTLFPVDERLAMIRELFADDPRVQVMAFEGLTVKQAASMGAGVIIRGLRAVADFEYELQMANMNRKLESSVETLFMMTAEEYFFVSSQNVKEVAYYGGDISGLVPPSIAALVRSRLARND